MTPEARGPGQHGDRVLPGQGPEGQVGGPGCEDG